MVLAAIETFQNIRLRGRRRQETGERVKSKGIGSFLISSHPEIGLTWTHFCQVLGVFSSWKMQIVCSVPECHDVEHGQVPAVLSDLSLCHQHCHLPSHRAPQTSSHHRDTHPANEADPWPLVYFKVLVLANLR